MKKFLISILAILLLSSCTLFETEKDQQQEQTEQNSAVDVSMEVVDDTEEDDEEGENKDSEETEETEESDAQISEEKITEYDLTEDEVKMLQEMGIGDDNIDAWIDEQKAMGPGPFDFNADLEDVSGGDATGYAGAIYEEGYQLFAQFEGLPHPPEGYFYEGWVVRKSPLSVLSTGEAVRSLGEYHNSFTSNENLLDHNEYVLTLEPDDGDPAPAEHILEGTMK